MRVKTPRPTHVIKAAVTDAAPRPVEHSSGAVFGLQTASRPCSERRNYGAIQDEPKLVIGTMPGRQLSRLRVCAGQWPDQGRCVVRIVGEYGGPGGARCPGGR